MIEKIAKLDPRPKRLYGFTSFRLDPSAAQQGPLIGNVVAFIGIEDDKPSWCGSPLLRQGPAIWCPITCSFDEWGAGYIRAVQIEDEWWWVRNTERAIQMATVV